MEDKIKCMICDKLFKRITRTHLKQHGITTDRYKVIFPDAPIVSEELSKKLAQPSLNMSSEERKKRREIAVERFSQPKSEDHKRKLSQARQGVSWGSHTEEHKQKMSILSKQLMEERLEAGWRPRPWTEEERLAISERTKRIRADKKWGGHGNKGLKLNLTDQQRANRSAKRVAWLQNNDNPMKNTSIERAFVSWCLEHDIQYIQQYSLEYKGSWLYDFLLPELNLLVETDGEYFHTLDECTINRDIIKGKVAYKRGYHLLRISDKNWVPEIIFETPEVWEDHTNTLITLRKEKLSKRLG